MRWLVFLFLLAGCRPAPGGLSAIDRFEVEIDLAPDGAARFRETITARVNAAAGTAFERRIAGDRTDGFADVSASIDGQSGADGPAGETSIASNADLSIHWQVAPAGDAPRVLEARYRALGVVEIQGMRGTFSWPVLPADRTYDIGVATVSIRLPQGTRILRTPGMGSTGWEWTVTPATLVGTKTNVSRTESAILSAELALDAVPMLEPRWQTRALLGQQLTPSFIAAALFILVTAGGILYAIRLQYFREPRDSNAPATSTHPEVARGLRTAGVVVIVLGLASAVLAYAILRPLGPWSQAVPASLVLVGLWFVAAGRWYRRSG